MPAVTGAASNGGAPDKELVGIIGRARRLGIAAWRVATALRVSRHELETIEAHIDRTERQQQTADAGSESARPSPRRSSP